MPDRQDHPAPPLPLLAHLALKLVQGYRIHGHSLPHSAVGVSPLRALASYTLVGDREFRWVPGVKMPPYRLWGGREVETGWKEWMGKVRNYVETHFSAMVGSQGLHRTEVRSFAGFLAEVNLFLLV